MPSVLKRTHPKKKAVKKSAPAIQRQVADRWTERLVKKGWTPVSDFFLKNYERLNITNLEAMVIIHLMMHKWDSKAPFPALKTLAKRMGIATQSVRAHLRSLERKKLLYRQMKTGTTNRFHLELLFQALEGLMDQDAKKTKGEDVNAEQ